MINNQTTTQVDQAAQWLRHGFLLSYPTESVWGIGCDAYNHQAVLDILTIKQRPLDKGVIVVTDSVARLEPLLIGLTDIQRHRVVESWESQMHHTTEKVDARQANTWVLPLNRTSSIPKWITGQHDAVAVRVIEHPLIKSLCEKVVSAHNRYGFVVSTSCNPSGEPPATTFEEANLYFGRQCVSEEGCNKNVNTDMIVNAKMKYLLGETLKYTQPSQIRDALTGKVIR